MEEEREGRPAARSMLACASACFNVRFARDFCARRTRTNTAATSMSESVMAARTTPAVGPALSLKGTGPGVTAGTKRGGGSTTPNVVAFARSTSEPAGRPAATVNATSAAPMADVRAASPPGADRVALRCAIRADARAASSCTTSTPLPVSAATVPGGMVMPSVTDAGDDDAFVPFAGASKARAAPNRAPPSFAFNFACCCACASTLTPPIVPPSDPDPGTLGNAFAEKFSTKSEPFGPPPGMSSAYMNTNDRSVLLKAAKPVLNARTSE